MIKPINELSRESAFSFGSKAANLGELIHAGVNVPNGFALSFHFFKEYLKHNHIEYLPEQYLAHSKEIRDQILTGQFSEELTYTFTCFLNKLQQETENTSLAVRSSSMVEDSENYSMAGMFDSFINLHTDAEVEEAVKICFASLFSDKVIHFLFENNIPFHQLQMGVIVQKFMVGKPSGVIFTVDTIQMDDRKVHINAVDSICTDYVSGSLPSSLYILGKENGSTLDIHKHQTSPVLNDGLLQELYRLSVKCEQTFGCPLDIEWTFSQDKVYILQARPITTLKTKEFKPTWERLEDDQYSWFPLLPSPYTPLMQDIIKVEIGEQSQSAYETLFRTDTYGECTIQNGYVYVREKQINDIKKKREIFLVGLNEHTQEGKCIFHDIILPVLLSKKEGLDRYVGKELSPEDAIDFIHRSWDYLKFTWRNHWLAVQANEVLYKFEEEILKTFDDLSVQDFYDLVYGFSLLSRERELLFSMSHIVKNNDTLRKMFDSLPYDEILYARLKSEPEAEGLLKVIELYVTEFGICDSGLDTILHPVVRERPDYAIGQIRNILAANETIFFEGLKEAISNKQRIKDSILQRLSPEKHLEFLSKLSLAEKAFVTNDNHNYYMERMYRGYIRLASMEAGRILVNKKNLDNPEDIQYLSKNEIISVLESGKIDPEIIAVRKREYMSQKRIIPPEILGASLEFAGSFGTNNTLPGAGTKVANRTIIGVSGLRKKVRGIVQVGLSQSLEEERILVLPHCHCVDILPMVNKLKGLIYNWGSPYDHPAIIAREMNILAIYKTNNAMDILKTGDEVEMDGFTGIITII